jgi:mRNA interferase YafQ
MARPKDRAKLVPAITRQFKKDRERQVRRGYHMGKLLAVVEMLCNQEELPAEFKDHPLKGNWKGHRDCHIEPDWLLIYKVTKTELILVRTGAHSDLF